MSLYFAGEIEFVVSFLRASGMSFYKLKLEFALEGSSKYISWKDRMETMLEDNRLKEFIEKYIPKTPTADSQDLAEWRKCVTKARSIILEGVGDHIVSNLHGKDTPYVMWQALIDLFQNNSGHMKLELKEMLQKINMEKGNTIP